MATGSKGPPVDQFAEIRAIKSCLEQLECHAAANGIPLAANLIGAASRAIADELAQRRTVKHIGLSSEVQAYDA